MSEQNPSPPPDPSPDLSLVSTPDLVERLLAELSLRHDRDAFAVIVERDNDGNQPVGFERFYGHASRLEGMIASAHRFVQSMNDRDRGRWNYTSKATPPPGNE